MHLAPTGRQDIDLRSFERQHILPRQPPNPSCWDKFKKIWKFMAGIVLIALGIPIVLTGLVAGGMVTLAGMAGLLPGLLIGPGAAIAMLVAGGILLACGISLLSLRLINYLKNKLNDCLTTEGTVEEYLADKARFERSFYLFSDGPNSP